MLEYNEKEYEVQNMFLLKILANHLIVNFFN